MNFYGFIIAVLYAPYEQEPSKDIAALLKVTRNSQGEVCTNPLLENFSASVQE